jgi:hypothetical protein
VTFGPVPPEVVHLIAIYSLGRNFLLDYMFGNSSRPGATLAEHLEDRDKEIDVAVSRFALEEEWRDATSLYVTITARRQIPHPIDVKDHHPRHFWIPEEIAKTIIEKHKNDAEAMIGFGIARSTLGPPYRHSGATHPGCPRYVVKVLDMEPCPLIYSKFSAKGTVTRGTWNEAFERFQNQDFTLSGSRLADYKVIGRIGMWHLAAYNESDGFRRFMWSYIGLEVLIDAIAIAGREDFTSTIGASSTLGPEVIKELLWPPSSLESDPNRSVRFRFALAAALLSPDTAAIDVAQFVGLNQYRNNIHGRMIPSSEAPAIEAFALFERYAILAARYLGSRRAVAIFSSADDS